MRHGYEVIFGMAAPAPFLWRPSADQAGQLPAVGPLRERRHQFQGDGLHPEEGAPWNARRARGTTRFPRDQRNMGVDAPRGQEHGGGQFALELPLGVSQQGWEDLRRFGRPLG